jgi:Prealbumin-like fold domain
MYRLRHVRAYRPLIALVAITAMIMVGIPGALASHPEVSLPGSNFEIDTNANLKVDDPAPSIDWASVTEIRKADLASGSGDDSFGQGTKEDTAVPTVVSGSIPPQKSDLLTFGIYLETTATGARFLNLFWHRVQEPQGTTNMDFEFNQSSTISANGKTPVRTAGDLLIQYDLSQGGTNPVLFLSRWVTSGATSQCEASNSLPCWSTKDNLSSAGDAAGSINTTAIPAAESDGLGGISARTFGEAQLDFDALGGGTGSCTSFGSAYLKSRSSDSFTSAVKDFIAPAATNISNCGSVIIRKETDPDEDPNTTVFGYTKAFPTAPASTNTFTLVDDGSKLFNNVLFGTGYTVDEDVVPAGWELASIDCNVAGHPSVGVTPTISVADGTVTFDIDAATDVLDCTYTNRARGTIIVEKITDDGFGAFDFTSGTLTPASFTLTTTAAGAAGKDSRTFLDLAPGTYDVAETVPAGWNLVSAACDDGSDPASIGLSAGETVTCSFHDARERGAILITKLRKHAAGGSGDQPHPGVTFTITGGSLPAGGTPVVTGADGTACLDNLVVSSLVGNYTVTETVPAGYHAEDGPATVVVDTEATCADNPFVGEPVTFHNTPLTDITVSVDSQVPGGTSSTIDCDPVTPGPDAGPGDDISHSLTNLEPQTVVCTIIIDP